MKSLFYFVFFAALANFAFGDDGVGGTGPGVVACPAGESWQCLFRCSESCDQKDCDKEFNGRCIWGCYCDGLPLMVRIDGQCKKRKACDITCEKDEVWMAGNECTRRCKSEELACDGVFSYGCYCAEGLVRIDGKCVSEKECQNQECPEDRYWNDCGDPCGATMCPGSTVQCISTCVPGCYCREGLVEINGKCVDPNECPSAPCETVCGRNQEYRLGNNCTDQCGLQHQLCDTGLRWGCYCKEGYGLYKGECVPMEECVKEQGCPEGMDFQCGMVCDYLCNGEEMDICREKNEDCTNGCYCPEGYFPVAGRCEHREEYCRKLEACAQNPNCQMG